MAGFALYREPGQKHVMLIRQRQGTPQTAASHTFLTDRQGFVFAPFAISEATPLLLIEGDPEEAPSASDLHEVADEMARTQAEDHGPQPSRSDYAADFEVFHRALADAAYEKLVLARSLCIDRTTDLPPCELFFRACRMYPQQFVALISTPATGTWLMATPETLLSREDDCWRTMALAGTMPGNVKAPWSDKNVREQRYVSAYIRAILERMAVNIEESRPHTVTAGSVVHLQTDFRFTLPTATTLGSLLDALHPTPAVCGLPKEQALRFILRHEHTDRRYYAGFAGPLGIGRTTHLYVSLRCMELFAHSFRLYAGGGLISDSIEQQEWEETEAKLMTMQSLLKV